MIQLDKHSSNVYCKDGNSESVVVALRDVLAKTEPSRTPPGRFKSVSDVLANHRRRV